MDQWQTLSIDDLRKLIKTSLKHNRPIEIDWVNKHIRVLSDVKTHPTKIISTGPLQYQDILCHVQGTD